jgi:hypothetical protein
LSLANLLEYENRALSTRICQRVMDTCTKPTPPPEPQQQPADTKDDALADQADAQACDADEFPAAERGLDDATLHAARMDYPHFIPFMLAEVDKNTSQSLNYWFRLLDIDHDHVLSLFELDWFFSEQVEKIQALSTDVIRWNDIVCQLLDMIKSSTEEVQRHGALPAASAAIERVPSPLPAAAALTSPPHRLHTAPPPLSASSLAFEFSTCHLTRKDLANSKLQSYFFNLFFNLPRFLTHESRCPVRARALHEAHEQGISEWEQYAAATYQALVANEELQARALEQQQQHQQHEHEQQQQEEEMGDGDVEAGNEEQEGEAVLQEEQHDIGMAAEPQGHENRHPQPQQEQQHTHFPGVVRRSPKRQAELDRRAQLQHEGAEDEETGADDTEMEHSDAPADHAAVVRSHMAHQVAASLSAASREFMERRWGIGSGAATDGHEEDGTPVNAPVGGAGHVQVFSEPGAHCFFVQDEDDELSSPEPPAAAPLVETAHAQMPAAAAMLLAQAHQPMRQPQQQAAAGARVSLSKGSAVSSLLRDRERLRQEEREFLELQRKIHSSPTPIGVSATGEEADEDADDLLVPDEEGAEEEEGSPAVSSRPISIPQSVTGSSPQMAQLTLLTAAPSAHTSAVSSVSTSSARASISAFMFAQDVHSHSPPSSVAMAMSTAPRRTSPHAKGSGMANGQQTQQHAGKENDDAHGQATGNNANNGYKRQLFGSEKQPLSPQQPNQWH